jgi:hypothetical protein
MPRLDEAAKRCSTFVEGVPVVLADGQAWHFPKPTIDLFPAIGPDGKVTDLAGKPSFGPEYDDLMDAFHQAATPADQLKALFALAVDLLGRNYDFSPTDYERLLRYRAGDPACESTWQKVVDVALGIAPKASPVGGAPT